MEASAQKDDCHRPGNPDRGARQDHAALTMKDAWRMRASTSPSFAALRSSARGGPSPRCPSLMARICGICPVSHLIASAKACDALLAVRIPPTADKLRRIFGLAQVVQSHALSFFYLSSPDLLLGMDADPAKSNLIGVLEQKQELARDGIRLRQFGQQIIERLGGKRIHPAWVVPGGVSEPLIAVESGCDLGRNSRSSGHRRAHPRMVQEHHREIPRRNRQLRQLPHTVPWHRQEGRRPYLLRRRASAW